MQKIAIIDYGSGNLRSAARAFEAAARNLPNEFCISITNHPDEIRAADRIVLPGQGAFGDCINALSAIDGMRDSLHEAVLQNAKPFFGICVGMQLMADIGHEHGQHAGLGWIPGTVDPLRGGMSPHSSQSKDKSVKIPHMGWNSLTLHTNNHPVLQDIGNEDHVYFIHSYVFNAADPSHVLASTDYGGQVTAIIGRDNLFGTQFHPEKSQKTGQRMITNFLAWSV